jgi:hypothetical protein
MPGTYYVLILVKTTKMNKKYYLYLSLLIIIVFIVYMIIDSLQPDRNSDTTSVKSDYEQSEDMWKISDEFRVTEGKLKAVSVSPAGRIFLGGDSFISCYDKDMKLIWNLKTPSPVTSLSVYGDTIFASSQELVFIVNKQGEMKNEWGPFEDSCIITSISSNRSFVSLADAGNKMILILDKGGEVKKIIGQKDGQFIVPSPYFDVALADDNTLFVANTGHRRVEKRNIQGDLKSYFGEPGLAQDAFCGCCNPSHFILIPGGFVTSEKGINRIKILNDKGEFVELISSKNNFTPSVPLNLASADGKTIYAANPADSKLYVFVRK